MGRLSEWTRTEGFLFVVVTLVLALAVGAGAFVAGRTWIGQYLTAHGTQPSSNGFPHEAGGPAATITPASASPRVVLRQRAPTDAELRTLAVDTGQPLSALEPQTDQATAGAASGVGGATTTGTGQTAATAGGASTDQGALGLGAGSNPPATLAPTPAAPAPAETAAPVTTNPGAPAVAPAQAASPPPSPTPTPAVANPPAKRPKPASTSGKAWTATAGSYTDRNNAEQVADSLADQGVAADIEPVTVKGKTYYRVRAGRYASRAGADEAAKKVEAAGYPSAVVPTH